MIACRVPRCMAERATGRHCFFCVDHALALRPGELRFLTRASINAERTRNERERDHLNAQLEGHVRAAIEHLSSRNEGASHQHKEDIRVS